MAAKPKFSGFSLHSRLHTILTDYNQHLEELVQFTARLGPRWYVLSTKQLVEEHSQRCCAPTCSLQVFSREPAATEEWAERQGLDGGLILTAGAMGLAAVVAGYV